VRGFGVICATASQDRGLLVRLWRPSVTQSVRSRGGHIKVCDHAVRAPAASHGASTGAPERSSARVARHDIVQSGGRSRMVAAGTMSSPARPGGGPVPACRGARTTSDQVRRLGLLHQFQFRPTAVRQPWAGIEGVDHSSPTITASAMKIAATPMSWSSNGTMNLSQRS